VNTSPCRDLQQSGLLDDFHAILLDRMVGRPTIVPSTEQSKHNARRIVLIVGVASGMLIAQSQCWGLGISPLLS
jgi:hypothetical protein